MTCKSGVYTVASNAPAARGTYLLRLEGPAPGFTAPGQFAQLAVPGFFLRRPFSVCDWDAGGFSVLYRAAGEGTRALANMAPGGRLEALTGLGQGFSPPPEGAAAALIGGGTGVSPLYGLARRLLARGLTPRVLLGFESRADAALLDAFAALGLPVALTTADGSAGRRGLVTEALAGLDYGYFYACGPLGLLRALDEGAAAPGELSLEARMGCGFGACMGCTVATKNGPRRVCREGPVFQRGELLW